MSEFRIPDEWRNEFIKAYIPLIAGIDSVGVYKDKIEGLTTEEVYKIIYFCEVSSRKEWIEGMKRFDNQQRDLALRYLNCRGSIVPRLAIPFSNKNKKYRDKIFNVIKFLFLLSVTLFFFSNYLLLNFIIYILLILSVLYLIFLYFKSKKWRLLI
tara:strand:+ start:576 stop:1040 length:465 start_codon:yes stop_codon:yes gene_type:complete